MSERRQEEDYFARIEREKKEKLKARLDASNEEAAADQRRELHFHKCGKCGSSMETKVFKGVEIEICPECGAVLLDPGELEELAGEDKSGVISALSGFFGGR